MSRNPKVNPWQPGVSIFSTRFRDLINSGIEEAGEAYDKANELERLLFRVLPEFSGAGVAAQPFFFAHIDDTTLPQFPDPTPPPWEYEFREVVSHPSDPAAWVFPAEGGITSANNRPANNLAEYNGVPNGVDEGQLPGSWTVRPIQTSRIVMMWIVQFGDPQVSPPAFWFDSPNGIDGNCNV